MQNKEIEKAFKEGKLADLMAIYETLFTKIEEYQATLIAGKMDDPYSVNIALEELTGIHMSLNFVCVILRSLLDKHEATLFAKLKGEAEEFGKAPNAAIIKKQALAITKEERHIYKTFVAFNESSDKAIWTLKTILKNLNQERMLSR